jgi:glycosyltransferase involved in cell wall biosynthesis
MPWEQTLWSRRLGPNLNGFEIWIDKHAAQYDLAISMTYMYPTSSIGLPLLSRRVPTLMFPTAHDESAYRMQLFRSLALLASGIACLTPEEEDLVHRVSKPSCPISTVGLGFNSLPTVDDRFLPNELQDSRYLVAVGRVDFGKGTSDLVDLFRNYKNRFPSDLKLALVGESAFEEDDVIPLGFCSEEQKQAVLKHSEALVHPSFLESFSIVLCEAWLQGRPVLVNSLCDVTLGQVRRSGGGLGFASQLEFDQSINSLLSNKFLATDLGQKGRRYVLETYDWAQVMSRFHDLSTKAIQYFEEPLVRHAITQ